MTQNLTVVFDSMRAYGDQERTSANEAAKLEGRNAIRVQAFLFAANNCPATDDGSYAHNAVQAYINGVGQAVKAATVASYTSVLNGFCFVARQGALDLLISRIDRSIDTENDPKARAKMTKAFFSKLGKIVTEYRKNPLMSDVSIRGVLLGLTDKSALDEVAAHCVTAHKALSAMIDKSASLGENITKRTTVYREAMNSLVILSGYLEGLAQAESAERTQAKADQEATNRADADTLAKAMPDNGGFIQNKVTTVDQATPTQPAEIKIDEASYDDELANIMDAVAA